MTTPPAESHEDEGLAAMGKRPAIMQHASLIVNPAESAWLVARGRLDSGDVADWCRQVEAELRQIVALQLARVLGPARATGSQDSLVYVRRAWPCLRYHWEHGRGEDPGTLSQVVQRLSGSAAETDWGILHDVLLAAGLEELEPGAARVFEERYQGLARSIAFRCGGHVAEDLVANLAAELILPRPTRPPRIRDYQGRTTLASWLRVVVTNLCLSQLRRKRPQALEQIDEVPGSPLQDFAPQGQGCTELLGPVLREVIQGLEFADRLLIKLLLLDEVPQVRVADQLRVHAGNVTRRKQRVVEKIWVAVRAAQDEHPQRTEFRDCMETLVAGSNAELSTELASRIGSAFRADLPPLAEKGA